MNIAYKNSRLKKQLSSATEIKKAFGSLAVTLSRRLAQIEAADNLSVLQKLPGPNCHPLTGNRPGQWAVNLSGNYRLIFELAHDPLPLNEAGGVDTVLVTDICLIETTDYH